MKTVEGAILTLLGLLLIVQGKKECQVDPEGEWDDPNNIYHCKDAEECCIENGGASCCSEQDPKVEILKQVELWGGLLAFLLVLGVVIWWCRRDSQIFEGEERPICQKFCPCCFKSSATTENERKQKLGAPPPLVQGPKSDPYVVSTPTSSSSQENLMQKAY